MEREALLKGREDDAHRETVVRNRLRATNERLEKMEILNAEVRQRMEAMTPVPPLLLRGGSTAPPSPPKQRAASSHM
jgi:hypothetical protein